LIFSTQKKAPAITGARKPWLELMDYPSEFSPEARDRVEKEKIRVYQELLPSSIYDFHQQGLAIRCVMRIFLTFAKEACALRKVRGWTIEDVERASGVFLRKLTITVLSKKFPDLHRHWICNSDGSIAPDVERRFRASAEWKEYDELLLTTPIDATTNAAVTSTVDSSPAKAEGEDLRPNQAPKSWQEIEITFLSDHRVEICYGGANRKNYNYGELGFQDRRSGKSQEPKPARAWIILCEFAKQNGTLPRSPAGKGRTMMQKRIEEIREKLRLRFGIETDPIPFNGDTYQTSFKIGCGASFNT
jgi:hypothetical protein